MYSRCRRRSVLPSDGGAASTVQLPLAWATRGVALETAAPARTATAASEMIEGRGRGTALTLADITDGSAGTLVEAREGPSDRAPRRVDGRAEGSACAHARAGRGRRVPATGPASRPRTGARARPAPARARRASARRGRAAARC